MCHAVLADDAAAVDAEGHWQALNGDIMDDGVIAALQERAVDGAVGMHAVLGKTSRKGHCVALADAHVKSAAGHGFKHQRHGSAAGHGSSDAHDFIVLFGKLHKGLAEHILILNGTAFAALGALTGFLVKLAGRVPCSGVGLGSGKALALDGAHMHQFGTCHVFYFSEHFDQTFHVMSVIQAEIADVQAFKDILLAREQ